MTDGPGDFDSGGTVDSGLHIIWDLLDYLSGRYEAEAVLAAFGEYIGSLTIEDMVGFVGKENAKMTLIELDALATKCGGKKLRYDELKENLHAFISERLAAPLD